MSGRSVARHLDILTGDIVSWLGPDHEFAYSLFGSNLQDYVVEYDSELGENITHAPIDFINSQTEPARSLEKLAMILSNVLPKVPSSLKPISMQVWLDQPLTRAQLLDWLGSYEFSDQVSLASIHSPNDVSQDSESQDQSSIEYEVDNMSDALMFETATHVEQHNALLSIAVSSLSRNTTGAPKRWFSDSNPWGKIDSEAAVAAVFVKPVVTANLCLEPMAHLESSDQFQREDRRSIRRYLTHLHQRDTCLNVISTHACANRSVNDELTTNIAIERANYPQVSHIENSYRLFADTGLCSGLIALLHPILRQERNEQGGVNALIYQLDSDKHRTLTLLRALERK
ncbi:hypothetical protein [Vibrio sp. WXL103]|uniref:hypothetical protein n=1 Tax=Vibrio sp. WXL103 TaxID=3450710 RepID=UPI003EC6B51D